MCISIFIAVEMIASFCSCFYYLIAVFFHFVEIVFMQIVKIDFNYDIDTFWPHKFVQLNLINDWEWVQISAKFEICDQIEWWPEIWLKYVISWDLYLHGMAWYFFGNISIFMKVLVFMYFWKIDFKLWFRFEFWLSVIIW